MSFWGELRRRNVFKVGAAYVIVAWLIVQVANTFFPLLSFPKWSVPLVAVLLILGFPIALIHAWAYEVTPEGIKRTKEVPLAESITHLTGKKLNYVLAGLLVVAVVYILFDNYYLDRRVIEPETVAVEQIFIAEDNKEVPKTIAVLPFADLSPEKDQEYFVDGLSEEILNRLCQISELTVIARTSSFTFKGSDKKIQEIASELGVAHILEGSVRKSGNELRITAQLVKGDDGSHIWSHMYDRKLKDIFKVQEDIATAVANELKVTFGIDKSLMRLGGTDNLEAYEHYLVAQGRFDRAYWQVFDVIEWRRALESVEAALLLDPEFASAWALKASIHLSISTFGPVDRCSSELEASLRASLKAVDIEPNLVDGYLALGAVKISRHEFLEAGYTFRKSSDLKTEPSSDLKFIILYYYITTGKFEKANKLAEEMLQNDPLNQNVRFCYLLSFGLPGDIERAEEEYERFNALSEDQWILGDQAITMIRLGAGDSLSRDDIVLSDPICDTAKKYLDTPEEGLVELRRLYSNNENLNSAQFFYISCWAAYFGDLDFALGAFKKALGIDAKGLHFVWYPVMREVRHTPRFKEFAKEVGLVDYWNEFGWPDICRPLDNGDFVCD